MLLSYLCLTHSGIGGAQLGGTLQPLASRFRPPDAAAQLNEQTCCGGHASTIIAAFTWLSITPRHQSTAWVAGNGHKRHRQGYWDVNRLAAAAILSYVPGAGPQRCAIKHRGTPLQQLLQSLCCSATWANTLVALIVRTARREGAPAPGGGAAPRRQPR